MPDFSASVLDTMKLKLQEVFQSRNNAPELDKSPVTAQAMAENQTANVGELYDSSGQTCIGYEVQYQKNDDTSVPSITGTPTADDCQIATGKTTSSDKVVYNPNIHILETMTENDKDCDNNIKFAERVAFNLASRMSLMAQSLNNYFIDFLDANKQVPSYTPSGATVSTNEIYITDTTLWEGAKAADLFALFDEIADIEGLPSNYLVINGKNFGVARQLARYHGENDNERGYLSHFQSVDNNLYYDRKTLDQRLGREVTFLVDPNQFATYFRGAYNEQMTPVGDRDNTMTFQMPLDYLERNQDPMRRQRTFQFSNGGVLVPVPVDIRYQKVCDNTNTNNGRSSLTHNWTLRLEGFLGLGPAEDRGGALGPKTGIIKIVKGAV